MLRLLLFLLGSLTVSRPAQRDAAWYGPAEPYGRHDPGALRTDPDERDGAGIWAGPPKPLPPRDPHRAGLPGPGGPGFRPRRRVAPWVKWAAGAAVAVLIFRRAIAAVVLMALSGALHLVGVNIHLPSIRFAWPWQAISTSTTTNTDLGPWVLQKIEGISRPALGEANFNFIFTHKVSKNIGPLPCWYASTFHAVGHASATVDLNPGPAWWAPGSGHYRLQVLSRPQGTQPGQVTVTMVLPRPQLPQSVHDITIDNIPSAPIDTQHSWTYPGLACGVLLRPQFPESVLYAQAQQIAFYKSTHVPQITGPLIKTAETQAAQTISDNFVQPTLNAFGYTLDRLTVRWATAP